jgi:hypothetical protein
MGDQAGYSYQQYFGRFGTYTGEGGGHGGGMVGGRVDTGAGFQPQGTGGTGTVEVEV